MIVTSLGGMGQSWSDLPNRSEQAKMIVWRHALEVTGSDSQILGTAPARCVFKSKRSQ